MKRKNAIEYLGKLCCELADMANESKDNKELLTGLLVGVLHALFVLNEMDDEPDSDPHDDALAMVLIAVFFKEVLL